MIKFFRSCLFSFLMASSVVLWSTISMITFFWPYKARYNFITFWGKILMAICRYVAGIKYEVVGLEHIPEKPCIAVCKHSSTWETAALQEFLRPQVWVLKKELMSVPFFGWALRLLDPIAIDRSAGKEAMNQVVDQGKQRLESGRWVVIFPEGTRVPYPTHKPFKSGAFTLANETGADLLPVAHNAGKFWRRRGFLKTPGTVKLVFGPVIKNEGQGQEALKKAAEKWITETTDKLG